MKQKILEALKTKYKTLGLSESAFDGVAELLAETVKEEKEVDTAISSPKVLGLLKVFQGDSDRLRTENHRLQEELEKLKKQPEPDKDKINPSDELSKQIAELKKEQSDLKARLAAEDKHKKDSETIKSVHELLKSDKYKCTNETVRNLVLKGYKIGEQDTAESIAEKAKDEYNSTYKELYGNGTPPAMGGSSTQEKFDAKSEVARLQALGKIPKTE